MDTSKLLEEEGGYVAGVSVFSGRRDPQWPLDAAQAQDLLSLWESLEPFRGTAAPAPPLGYRGSFVRGGGREWLAHKGAVTLRQGQSAETRLDPGRRFERAVVSSAPEGTVPYPFLDAELRP